MMFAREKNSCASILASHTVSFSRSRSILSHSVKLTLSAALHLSISAKRPTPQVANSPYSLALASRGIWPLLGDGYAMARFSVFERSALRIFL
ncbi:hypothetical protein [Sphingopyxis sp. GW247-27LB]|uniref:hypothetical protein n=2 Tax=Alphaproteobacteria TaxID=28211 RepID=UPI00114108D6|nr:hypothetical protein [Sphingopyxis sp. GW247-27LB]